MRGQEAPNKLYFLRYAAMEETNLLYCKLGSKVEDLVTVDVALLW